MNLLARFKGYIIMNHEKQCSSVNLSIYQFTMLFLGENTNRTSYPWPNIIFPLLLHRAMQYVPAQEKINLA